MKDKIIAIPFDKDTTMKELRKISKDIFWACDILYLKKGEYERSVKK